MLGAFHPSHIADLKKSGLTDETIQAAKIYTVTPGEIAKKLGGGDGGITSLLAFPYPGCNDYERFKVWYEDGREKDNKGKSRPKYKQPKDSHNHLYLPPTVDLQGDSPLLVVEGEKKALALVQADFQVVGLAGVWNWCERAEGYKRPKQSRPIPDLDLVNWRRHVTILFDSDGHDNRNVRLAAFRLARELAKRGAAVSILFLPADENGEKVGADDYLVAHNPESLRDLLKTAWPFDPALSDEEVEISCLTKDLTPQTPLSEKLKRLVALTPILARLSNTEVAAILEELRAHLRLRGEDLAGLKADVKKARKDREAKEKKGQGKPTEIDDLQEGLRLHPAIDFLPEAMTIGFRATLADNKSGLLLVFSDGQEVWAKVNPEAMESGERVYQVIQNTAPPFLQDVWGLERLKAFLDHPNRPNALYTEIKETLRRFLDLPEPAYGLMAAWIVGTYFAHLFTAFPFLHFFGPKETGKSKCLEAMRYSCFNAWKGRDITAPALGDTADGQRGTVLFDQAEKLKSDKENGNLIGLLADSYKKAGGRRRLVEVSKTTGRTVLEFSTYGPKAFASTRNLDPDLWDRCVRIPMTRTRRKLPDLEGSEPIWGELRDKLYRFTLAAFKEVRSYYQGIPGDGTRLSELWRPMLAVLQALVVEQREIEEVRGLFMVAAEETRHEPTPWESRLLEVLQEEAGKNIQAFELTSAEVLNLMAIEGDRQPTRKWAGDVLSQFNLYQGKRRAKIEGKKETVYQFTPVRVIELCSLYLREDHSDENVSIKNGDTPRNDLSLVSPDDNANDFNKLDGTRENQETRPHVSPLEGGHEGTRPPETVCPLYRAETISENGRGHDGHEKSGGVAEKIYTRLPGEEVNL